MTSPGGNTVTIVVQAKDQTAPGFKTAEQSASKLGASLKKVGEIAGGILTANVLLAGAQKLRALFSSTVEAASALGESINAVNKTFGDSAKKVTDWGENNAASFGLSTRAFNQMATPLGAMLKNQGLAMDDVADHTLKLTQRAADMASVFNTDVTAALTAIQAGLRGEADPLERYGVSLSAVAVEAQALAETHKTAAAQLTAAEKATARLNLIYKQTASTAGDFADTSDGLANSQRIAAAEIENAKAKVGEFFLPVMAKAAQISGKFATEMTSIPGPVLSVVSAVVGLSVAVLLLAPRIRATSVALQEMAASGSIAQRGLAKTAAVVGKATAALALMAVVQGAVAASIGEELNPQIDALNAGLEETAPAWKLSGEAARVFGADLEVLTKGLKMPEQSGFDKFMKNLPFGLGGTTAALHHGAEALKLFDTALADLAREGKGAQAMMLLQKAADAAGLSVAEVKKRLPEYTAAAEAAAKGTNKLSKTAEDAVQAYDELEKSIKDLIETAFSLEEAQDAAAGAVADLSEAIKQQKEDGDAGAGSLDRNTEAGRNNAAMVRDLVRDYADLMQEAQRNGEAFGGLRQQLIDQLVSMGFSRAEAERYTETLATLKAELDKIQSKQITVKVNIEQSKSWGGGFVEFAHGGITGAAGGGPRGNRTLLGEHGPEIVDLAPGSMVHSNPDSMRMLNGGGGEVNVVLSVRSSGSALIDRILSEISAEVQKRGGDGSAIGVRTVQG